MTIKERTASMKSLYTETLWARMARVLPCYGAGGVINNGLKARLAGFSLGSSGSRQSKHSLPAAAIPPRSASFAPPLPALLPPPAHAAAVRCCRRARAEPLPSLPAPDAGPAPQDIPRLCPWPSPAL
eukprot:59894-Rhodomonas_salina.2